MRNPRRPTAQQSNPRKPGKNWTRSEAEREKVQKLGGDAERHERGQIRCAMRREGHTHEDGESVTRELEETKAATFLKGVESVPRAMRAWNRGRFGRKGPRGSRRVEA